MKKIIVVICIVLIIGIMLISGFYLIRRYVFDIEKPYYATVIDAKWSVVLLDSGERVALAGIEIPYDENNLNYMPELVYVLRDLIVAKKVKVELVERHRSGAYHKYDLVRIYLEDDTCINTYLLENGMAFFSHGYYRNKDREFDAEVKAKREKKGIWGNKEDLVILYIGSKHWSGVHYPECHIVKKIRPEDRLEFYERMPAVHWYRDWSPHNCPYCDEIKKTKPKHLR